MMKLTCVVAVLTAAAGTPLHSQLPTCSDTTEYVWLDGKDTIAVERVYIGAAAFHSRMNALSQKAHLVYFGQLGADGLVTEMTVNVWQPGADTARIPSQVASVRFAPTAVSSLVASPAGRVQAQQDSVSAGTMPFMTGVLVFLELAYRRARTAGLDSIPMLWLFTGGHREAAKVQSWALDSIRITMPQDTFRLYSPSRAGPATLRATSGGTALRQCKAF